MEKAGLSDNCSSNTTEAPGEAKGASDHELVTVACADWFMYIRWDRGQKRTVGNMRQEVLLMSDAAGRFGFGHGFGSWLEELGVHRRCSGDALCSGSLVLCCLTISTI